MQEFLANNTVNCNLMSLTGYRTLVLLHLLIESPKSTEEINQCFMENQYIKEKFSKDTLRIYINSLRAIGCNITRANKSNGNKYELIYHPFNFDIKESQLEAIAKLHKTFYDKIEIKDLLNLNKLFHKISKSIKNEKTKNFLSDISMFKNVDTELINQLLTHCNNKNQISILYKSPRSNEREIEIIADKIAFKSGKLYFWGQSITHGEYSYLRVDRIIKILTIKIRREEKALQKVKYIYELSTNNNYIPDTGETIIEKTDHKFIIEAISENKFSAIQKILHNGADCKIISPNYLKDEIIHILQSMKEIYE